MTKNNATATTTTQVAVGISIAAITSVTVMQAFRWYKSRLESTKPFENLPMVPGNHWLLGHALKLQGDFEKVLHEFVIQHANSHGLTSYWLMKDRAVAIGNLVDARAVLLATSHRKGMDLFSHHLSRVFGKTSIGLLQGRKWKRHRSILQSAFHNAGVQSSQTAMIEAVQVVMKSIKTRVAAATANGNNMQADMESICKMITMDVFCAAALSDKRMECCHSLTPSPFVEAFEFMTIDLMRRLYNPISWTNNIYAIPTQLNRKFEESRNLVRGYLETVIRKRQEIPPSERPNDVLTGVINEYANSVDGDCTEEEDNAVSGTVDVAIDALNALLFAGYDTTAVTVSVAFWVLATRPDIESNVCREVERVGPNNVEELHYTRAVLMEVLRLYPVGDHTLRNLEKPLTLPSSNGTVLPKGTMCMIPIYTLNRHPSNFPRPLEFLPERWAREVQPGGGIWEQRQQLEEYENKHEDDNMIPCGNPQAMLSFSAGPRKCIGQQFAMHESVLILSYLIQQFQFRVSDSDANYKFKMIKDGLVCRPRGGVPMEISLRP